METANMEIKLAKEIIACLPRGRTVFHYGKHGYALRLLSYLVGRSARISDIKQSQYGKLLYNPVVKPLIATSGKGILKQSSIELAYWQDTKPFVLTLAVFDDKLQTSRSGVNLVLQLNFNRQHDCAFQNLAKPGKNPVMRYEMHPVMLPGKRELFRETLAWSRIDLDFDCNEALIEEVQSDWVREANQVRRWIDSCRKYTGNLPEWFELAGALDQIETYLDKVLAPYLALWQEAMLSAAIDFIYRELGIKTIYYHSHATGCIVKRIAYSKPPRSLYSQLPRKFCFTDTAEAPDFLMMNKGFRRHYKKVSNPNWYRMKISPLVH
jgi:hypothetical protein